MAATKESRGSCQFCGEPLAKRSITKHFKTCSKAKAAISAADAKQTKAKPLYHIVVQDKYAKDFWLHLEINGNDKLQDLDSYLRAIWLECCGHLSEFSVRAYDGQPFSMGKAVKTVFSDVKQLEYVYDFGTSSELIIKVVGERSGHPLSKYPIFLMARNDMPIVSCMECDKAARWLCMECIYEHQESGFLCDEHADSHEHDEYGDPIRLVNSPRMGMCGYDGPAEAPY